MTKKIKSSWLYYTGRAIFRLMFGIIWRWEIKGQENIPADGGVIIAPNHRSYADPPLTGSAMERPLHFMAKEELFGIPVLGFLINRTNAFPVNRGAGDVGAFKTALNLLENGETVLVFPEGTRAKDVDFRPAKQGAGMLACRAQVPVVPARIFGNEKIGKFRKIRVIFGKPLHPPKEYTKDDYGEFSEAVMDEIKKLSW
ncbi:MAG: lysophospholipid acyltransferase family protein [Elusimicrobiota bacterium]